MCLVSKFISQEQEHIIDGPKVACLLQAAALNLTHTNGAIRSIGHVSTLEDCLQYLGTVKAKQGALQLQQFPSTLDWGFHLPKIAQ